MSNTNTMTTIFKDEIVSCVVGRLNVLTKSKGEDFANSIYGMNRIAEQAARDYVKNNYKSVSIVWGEDGVNHHAKAKGDFIIKGKGFYSIPSNEAAIILHTCKKTIRKMMIGAV